MKILKRVLVQCLKKCTFAYPLGEGAGYATFLKNYKYEAKIDRKKIFVYSSNVDLVEIELSMEQFYSHFLVREEMPDTDPWFYDYCSLKRNSVVFHRGEKVKRINIGKEEGGDVFVSEIDFDKNKRRAEDYLGVRMETIPYKDLKPINGA